MGGRNYWRVVGMDFPALVTVHTDVFPLNCDWRTALLASVIGQSNNFGFGFMPRD